MKTTRINYCTEIPRSYRAARVASRLDDSLRSCLSREIVFQTPPELDQDWRVGLVLGPSGSGKSSAARKLYPDSVDWRPVWNDDAPVIELFDPEIPFETLQSALAAVGFASPVRQLQRYSSLSVGERFRADLARSLLEAPGPVAVVDEFTSALDRPTARGAAIAARKAIDRGLFHPRRLVAISCHDDVEKWLEPDWTLRMPEGLLRRGRLRRPKLALEVRPAHRALWPRFKTFHYLSGAINSASQCYVATLDDSPVAFAAILQCEGRHGVHRVHRLVVLPELQGLGIGGAFLDALAELEREHGATLEIVTGAPFFIRRLARSPMWRLKHVYPHGRVQRHHGKSTPDGSFGRATVSFRARAAATARLRFGASRALQLPPAARWPLAFSDLRSDG